MVRFPAGRIRAAEEPQRWRNRSGASSLFVFDYLINDGDKYLKADCPLQQKQDRARIA